MKELEKEIEDTDMTPGEIKKISYEYTFGFADLFNGIIEEFINNKDYPGINGRLLIMGRVLNLVHGQYTKLLEDRLNSHLQKIKYYTLGEEMEEEERIKSE